jgi:hypothetical protein
LGYSNLLVYLLGPDSRYYRILFMLTVEITI